MSRRINIFSLIIPLYILVLSGCSSSSAGDDQIVDELQVLSGTIIDLQSQVSSLHNLSDQLSIQFTDLESESESITFDFTRVGPGRWQSLPNPPDGKVTVQFIAEDDNGAVPGDFTFHLAPEGATLFETASLEEGKELVVGPTIEDGIAFVDPGVFYLLQVVYQNPTDEEISFLVRGGVLDPQAALPYVRNRCWCAAITFTVPPNGTFSRMIEVGVGPDTPAGAKAIVIFPIARVTE